MNVELSESLQQALDANPNQPLRIVDPRTQQVYVLIRADLYEQAQSHPVEEFDIREAYPLMDAIAGKEGWDNPDMDIYDRLPPQDKP